MLKLHGYWRSSAAYRVRIALNLKNIPYEQVSVPIAPSIGGQYQPVFKAMNPQMRVPVLETGEGVLTQSMAMLEWIEETYPGVPILPAGAFARAQCRAFADTIACDVHPLNNVSVLVALKTDFGASPEQVNHWYGDWILKGFAALEVHAAKREGAFIYGDMPSLAEICLIPQIYNARRYDVDLSVFPELLAVDAACDALEAFQLAAPQAQPDAT